MLSRSSHYLNHPTHDAVFDNKYMKLFDARPITIRTFGLSIKYVLISSNIELFRHFGNTFIFCATSWVYQTTEDWAGSGASEEDQQLFMDIRDRYRYYIPVYTDDSRDGNYVVYKYFHQPSLKIRN